MTARVRLLPSGHTFVSEGQCNLLEAGLRSGLALGYGCSNGNCGKCLAKIVSGEVKKIQAHDYSISPEKAASGHILMCCNTALTDVVLEAPEAQGTDEIPRQQLTAKVRNIQIVNADVALLHLKTPRTQRLRFLAGQQVQLGGNAMPVASHSVGSCPCDDMHLHFQIPLLRNDAFSAYVFNDLKKGDRVEVNGPDGDFVLDEDSPRALVFIAWHTGFAPVRSLIEQAMALELAAGIQLVWLTTTPQDRYLDNLCRSWEDAFDDFSYSPIDTEIRDGYVDIYNILINRLHIDSNKLDDYNFYVAGQQSLLDACRTTLLENGLPAAQLSLDSLIHE